MKKNTKGTFINKLSFMRKPYFISIPLNIRFQCCWILISYLVFSWNAHEWINYVCVYIRSQTERISSISWNIKCFLNITFKKIIIKNNNKKIITKSFSLCTWFSMFKWWYVFTGGICFIFGWIFTIFPRRYVIKEKNNI